MVLFFPISGRLCGVLVDPGQLQHDLWWGEPDPDLQHHHGRREWRASVSVPRWRDADVGVQHSSLPYVLGAVYVC